MIDDENTTMDIEMILFELEVHKAVSAWAKAQFVVPLERDAIKQSLPIIHTDTDLNDPYELRKLVGNILCKGIELGILTLVDLIHKQMEEGEA